MGDVIREEAERLRDAVIAEMDSYDISSLDVTRYIRKLFRLSLILYFTRPLAEQKLLSMAFYNHVVMDKDLDKAGGFSIDADFASDRHLTFTLREGPWNFTIRIRSRRDLDEIERRIRLMAFRERHGSLFVPTDTNDVYLSDPELYKDRDTERSILAMADYEVNGRFVIYDRSLACIYRDIRNAMKAADAESSET